MPGSIDPFATRYCGPLFRAGYPFGDREIKEKVSRSSIAVQFTLHRVAVEAGTRRGRGEDEPRRAELSRELSRVACQVYPPLSRMTLAREKCVTAGTEAALRNI